MARARRRPNVTMRERVDMAKFFIAISRLPLLGKPDINLSKMRDAYRDLNWNLKIV